VRRRIRTAISRWWWAALGAVGLSHERWLAQSKLTRRAVKAVVWIGIALIAIAVFGVWKSTALLAAIVLDLDLVLERFTSLDDLRQMPGHSYPRNMYTSGHDLVQVLKAQVKRRPIKVAST